MWFSGRGARRVAESFLHFPSKLLIVIHLLNHSFSIRYSVGMDRKSRTGRWKHLWQALPVDRADRKKDGAWRRRSGVVLKGGRFQETKI